MKSVVVLFVFALGITFTLGALLPSHPQIIKQATNEPALTSQKTISTEATTATVTQTIETKLKTLPLEAKIELKLPIVEEKPVEVKTAAVKTNRSHPLPDFTIYRDVSKKKQAFFDYLLPLIELSNLQIQQERLNINTLRPKINSMTADERSNLNKLAKKYGVKSEDPLAIVDELTLRIDIIPPSLALAQAANESAWGTSRFAKQGNNLFGQWCFKKGCGLIPRGRTTGQSHEVAHFSSVLASVKSYMRNLNSQRAYRDLRKRRQQLRLNSKFIDGVTLAETLIHYSSRKEAYIKELKAMMVHNDLLKLDLTI